MDRPTCPRLLILSVLLAAGCKSLEGLEELANQDPEDSARQDIAPPTNPVDALTAIARLEDARDDGGGLLQILAGTFGPEVRERAVLALGRLPLETHAETVTRSLVACLTDEDPRVRAAAAFSLGIRADPAAADAILEHWRDPAPLVRERLVEAAGRIDHPRLHAKVLASLRNRLSMIRQVAAIAPHAWPTEGAQAAATDLALAQRASLLAKGDPRAERMNIPDEGLEDPEVVWRLLFCLSRRKADAGRDAFHLHRTDADPLARLYAIKGLAGTKVHDAGRLALEEAMADPDARVVVEAARGLGNYADRRSLDALESGIRSEDPNVRISALEALAKFKVDTARVSAMLEGVRDDPVPIVRATALVGEASVRGALARPEIEKALRDGDPVVRAGAALAAGNLPSEHASELLLPITEDAHPRVAGMAISALANHTSDVVHARLLALLSNPDNGVRVAAATALATQPRPEDLSALEAAFQTSVGDVGVDVQVQVLQTAKAIGTSDALGFVARSREHAHPWVRRAARDLAVDVPGATTRPARLDEVPPQEEPALPLDPEQRLRRNPMVVVSTSKGDLVFELFPGEAPVHVHSFLALAERGHYDGLDFHRVVPDFVIQGGCYRGDGNGTGTWRGQDDSIRHEINPRRYVRGSLGMPRSAEMDSGGSQIFVTHRPTPHLDGRYTIFGELREGFDVLDAIVVGDRILGVKQR